MLNIEKYKNKLLRITVKEKISLGCAVAKLRKDNECRSSYCDQCNKKNINWLLKINDEEDIELTEAEKIILKNVDSDYEWIARDEDGTLGVYEKKPKKVDDLWSGSYRSFDLFEHLFQFIKWDDEKPYFIADILNNCEVIDDD